jgi:hypothetical protein
MAWPNSCVTMVCRSALRASPVTENRKPRGFVGPRRLSSVSASRIEALRAPKVTMVTAAASAG